MGPRVVRMGNEEGSEYWQVNIQERDLQDGLGADGTTILEWTLKK